MTTLFPLSKGDGENRTRFVFETKPESDLLDEVPPRNTSSESESGGVGLVGVPFDDDPPCADLEGPALDMFE